jgi:hypothetical protein
MAKPVGKIGATLKVAVSKKIWQGKATLMG